MRLHKKRTLTAVAITCVFTVTVLTVITFSSIPAAADVWYKGELSGPTAGKVGDTLTYSVQAWECSGLKPDETPSVKAGEVPGGSSYCSPLVGYFTTFSVADQSSIRGYGSSTDQQGHVSIGIPFPKAGMYQIAAGAPKFGTNVITVNIAAADNGGSNSGAGNSGAGNSGGDGSSAGSQATPAFGSASPSPSTSSNNTAAVFGLEQVTASVGPAMAWMWLLGLAVIILLVIIIVVLLVMRRS